MKYSTAQTVLQAFTKLVMYFEVFDVTIVTVSVYFKVIITDDGFYKEVETFNYLLIIFD